MNLALLQNRLFNGLRTPPLVIADITGHNANVFFEIGVRYSLRRNSTVLIKRRGIQIPFDLSNYRVHDYETFDERASEKLSEAILATLNLGSSDSPVYEVFPRLDVATNFSQKDSVMPWTEYQERIDKIRTLLSDTDDYKPDAVVGITKGGAAFADLLTQKMDSFKGATLALWADRLSETHTYFDNQINRQLLLGLKEYLNKDNKDIRILLVDEVIASGTTFDQAVKLFRTELPGCHVRFLPMVYGEGARFSRVLKTLLWKHRIFDWSEEEIRKLHLTNWDYLPWDKHIRRN